MGSHAEIFGCAAEGMCLAVSPDLHPLWHINVVPSCYLIAKRNYSAINQLFDGSLQGPIVIGHIY